MRVLPLLIISVVVLSCREIRPLESEVPINGYQLNGTVTTSNGIVLDSVSVFLFYWTDPVSYTPLDTVQVMITDSTKFVFVDVYNANFQHVRTLFARKLPMGRMPRFHWNEINDSLRYVPSGKYYIKYQYGDTVVKVDSTFVQGRVRTTITNSFGEFTIANSQLPIGNLFDYYRTDSLYFYNTDSAYVETDEVLPEISLVFTKGTLQGEFDNVVLPQNKIKYLTFKLQ